MASTTSTLTGLMQTFYDKRFLERAEANLRFDIGADKKNVPMNSGKVVYFTRFSTLAAVTSAITECAVPTAVDMSTTTVSATLAEYGTYVKVASLFEMTSIDDNLREHVEVLGHNAGLSLDTLIAAELSANATTQLAGAKSNVTAVAATDTLTGAEVRKAVRTLKTNKAIMFPNGYFRAIVQPYTAYDLFANSEWLDAYRYTDASNIQKGVLGRLHGVEFFESNNSTTESSTVTVYHNFFFGAHAYGIVNLANQPGTRMFIKNPGPQSTENPVDTYSTIGWKAVFAAKVLNSNWIINVKTGATA